MLKINIGRRRPPKASPVKLFHGVAIKPGEVTKCDAVLALAERRFLSDDAPRVPVEACTNPRGCRCVYQHFEDRRTSARRDSDVGPPQRLFADEKREGVGRRITDG